MAPLVSHLKELGLIEAVALRQKACFEAGVMFARGEGIVPAPEGNHAVRVAIDEALRCKQEGTARTILFNLSGHGNFDMQAYADYLAGKLPVKLDEVRAGECSQPSPARLSACDVARGGAQKPIAISSAFSVTRGQQAKSG